MNEVNVQRAGVNDCDVESFLNNPADFFDYSYERMHTMDRNQTETLQLTALKARFKALRDNVPMLKRLADEQRIDDINKIDDVVPLLFRHTVYKSYPASFLEKNRFGQLTQWLSKLTTHDLSGVDVSHCQGVDDWINTLDAQTPVKLRHSSGTTGVMSFIPRCDDESERAFFNMSIGLFSIAGAIPPRLGEKLSMHVVQPTYRSGNTSILRTTDITCRYIAGGDESKIHMLYPYKQSSDLMFLAARLRAAQAKGELERLEFSPALLARKAEFERLQKSMPGDLVKFFDDIIRKLKGERVYSFATSNLLYSLASKGLAEGIENVFAPDSILGTGGGAKGQILPPDWEDTVKKFFGVPTLVNSYGMSEVLAAHRLCSHGRYHLEPTAILFVLDPDSGEVLPREGIQTGRASFYDLMAETYWGGFISGDEITVDWSSQCGCGKKSAYLERHIERYSEKRGGDDKISCAAASDAHDAALDYLLEPNG